MGAPTTDDREAILARYRAELQEQLLRAFAGQHLVASGGPRQPGAFTARDVQEEVERWLRFGGAGGGPPDATRPLIADLTDPLYLGADDFLDGTAGPLAELSEAALVKIMGAAEGLRARTIAARQARIVGTFCRRLEASGVRYRRTPDRYLEVDRGLGTLQRVYPVVGVPDTPIMQRVHTSCGAVAADVCLLYDARAMLPDVIGHLEWLNEFAPVRALSLLQADAWIAKL